MPIVVHLFFVKKSFLQLYFIVIFQMFKTGFLFLFRLLVYSLLVRDYEHILHIIFF